MKVQYKKGILHVDSRNVHFHQIFGSTQAIATESHFSDGMIQSTEAPNGINCTEISTVKIAYSQTKNFYDVDSAWAETPHTAQGASMQSTMGSAVKNGLLNLITKNWDKLWDGYLRADTGMGSRFQNTQSAMTLATSASECASNWYANWDTLNPNEVMPQGDTIVSEHSWVVKDWKDVNGVTMFIVDAHQGYDVLMPQEVYNLEIGRMGCGAYIPAKQVILNINGRNIVQYIIDAIQNVIISFQH